MADGDLIACLYPIGGAAVNVVRAEENRLRYVGLPISSPVPPSEDAHNRDDRQSTQEPEEYNNQNSDHLEFRFSGGPKTSHGLVFGTDKNCDIVLPRIPGISSHHFTLTFDELYRPIVKDFGSLCGINITYDNQGGEQRRDFRWIVGGHEVPCEKTAIIIEVVKSRLTFQIVVSHHDINSQLYMDSVDRFKRGTAGTENLFGRLDLPPETEHPTGTRTPSIGAIFLRKKLGEGGFGAVTHLWNVSTAEECALKQPSLRAIRDKEVDVSAWKREAKIMSGITHVCLQTFTAVHNLISH